MTFNISGSSILSTGSSSSRSFGIRFSDILNVKDYGATGNGSTDDSAAIQSCFDVAFGTNASPHGEAGRFSNKPVFFPAGNYRIVTPLTITQLYGGWIFGEGMESTRLFYDGASIGTEPFSSILVAKLVAYSRFEGMTFDHPSNDGNMVGFYQYKNASFGNLGGTAVRFHNVKFKGGQDGCLLGYNVANGGDTCTFINCVFDGCVWGLRVASQNSLSHTCVGCTFKNCTDGISVISGSVFCTISCVFENNSGYDIRFGAGGECSAVVGADSSSQHFATAGGGIYIEGVRNANASAGNFFDNVDGFSRIVVDGCHSTNGKFLTNTGKLYLRGSIFDNASYLTGITGAATVPENI